MVGLLDISPLRKEITVRGEKMMVGGISALGVVHLMTEFPEVKRLLAGLEANATAERIMELGPEVIHAIIAAGFEHPGDEAYKQKASELMIGEQFDIVVAIVEVTFPQGLGPFAEKAREIGSKLGLDGRGWGRGTTLPVPSAA